MTACYIAAVGSVVVAARIVLAGVFAVAGAAKLFDLQGSRGALEAFGVPARAVRAGGVLLPLAELATAVALLFPASAQLGGVAALVLLLGFVVGISVALFRGSAPDCHCFGQLRSAPAGRGTLLRNGALAVTAAIVVLEGPGPSIPAWVEARSGAELAAIGLGAAAVALGAIASRLRRQVRDLSRDLADARAELAAFPPGLPIGAAAPSFSLPSVDGDTVSLEALCARGRPVALVFVAPGCGPCEFLFPELSRWQATVTDNLTIALVSGGTPAENEEAVREGARCVLLQEDSEVLRAYRVGGTPTTVVVTPDGRVASAPASGSVAIESLIRLTLRRHAASPAFGDAASARPVAQ